MSLGSPPDDPRRRERAFRSWVLAINRDKVEAAAIKLLQQGKYDKAILELKKLVEDDPTDVRTLLKLGDTFVKMGNKKDSIEAYEKAAGIYT